MEVVIQRELNHIKNGWAARSGNLKIVSHGLSPEIADLNLERSVRLFLAPFQREGTLQEELEVLGITFEGASDRIQVRLEGIRAVPHERNG